jgi:hypothetical protein
MTDTPAKAPLEEPPAPLVTPPDAGCWIRDPVTGALSPDPAYAPRPAAPEPPLAGAAPESKKGASK